MYILSQILNISSKNLLVNYFLNIMKQKIHNILDEFVFDFSKNRYSNLFLMLQNFNNQFSCICLQALFENLDNIFKNSPERKEKYFINKSNVERTLITIFGTITFKRTLYQNKITGEYYFYLDDILALEPYQNYDPLIKAILIEDSVLTNPNHTSFYSSLKNLNLINRLNFSIPRQTIYKFIQDAKIRKVEYKEIPHENVLYVMVDEKWIHEQDKENPGKKKWIMGKCFVTFTHIERKGKRTRLKGRHVFITSSDKPWKEFTNEIYKIYNFETLKTINLLSDAGSWILSGSSELKLYTNNKIIINTCEFHVKQKINRSTTDKELRLLIANIIYELENKHLFIKEMEKLIDGKIKEERKQKIIGYKNYILKHWKGIINMKHSLCKSSMEAHIQHCMAAAFSSVPKAYSKNNIESYFKFQEMFLNGIDIFNYYLDTYNSNEDYVYKKDKEVNFSIFDKKVTSNIPNLSTSNPSSIALYSLAHPKY